MKYAIMYYSVMPIAFFKTTKRWISYIICKQCYCLPSCGVWFTKLKFSSVTFNSLCLTLWCCSRNDDTAFNSCHACCPSNSLSMISTAEGDLNKMYIMCISSQSRLLLDVLSFLCTCIIINRF